MERMERWRRRIEGAARSRIEGRITEATGLTVKARLPAVELGELVEVHGSRGGITPAEVVAFRGDETVLMPLAEMSNLGPRSRVVATRSRLRVRCDESLRGRVLDGLGVPIDGGGPLRGEWHDVEAPPPDPLTRVAIERRFRTGIRAIDGLCALGDGQRVGLFAPAGVGKSTIIAQLARSSDADTTVICLLGERGREIRGFIDDNLGPDGLARSVVVCSPSNVSPLVRIKCAFVATTIAEFFRDRGQRVLLLVDSLTRFARAQRELGLAVGEPPSRQGYPPSVFRLMPQLLERAGTGPVGSITAIYSVLVSGELRDDPVGDEVKAIVDGHILLSAALAHRSHWPAIDVLQSVSRLMTRVSTPEVCGAAARWREWIAAYEERRDLITLGMYQPGSDRRTDEALRRLEAIENFLRQPADWSSPLPETERRLLEVAR